MIRLQHLFALVAFSMFMTTGCGDSAESSYTEPSDSTIEEPPKPKKIPPPVDHIRSLTTETKALVDSVFHEYKIVKMDPLDGFPKFKSAKKTIYKRLRRSAPVRNNRGDKTFPRLLIKSWEFANQNDLKKDVEAWLTDHESSQDSIHLGDEVQALKSPPMLCAITKTQVYIVQYSCMYEGENWTPIEEAFFNMMKEKEARYVWKISCKAGKFQYQ